MAPVNPAMPRKTDDRPRYSAPALEKGLDILELIAARSEGLGQSQIARELDRTPGEIFRMLTCLERRGYLARRDDRYRLTPKLFELAHQHPPTRRLVDTALPEMQRYADATEQSCHLAIRRGDHALIVAQVDSPGFIGFAVRVGRQIPLAGTCSGHVLLALAVDPRELGGLPGIDATVSKRLDAVRERGFEEMPSPLHDGITDVSFPVRDTGGIVVATLTTPYLLRRGEKTAVENARVRLKQAARAISEQLGADPGRA